MPHQNRVTPHGAIIATAAKGMLMGNRGCLHDAAGQIRRGHQTRRWIICLLAFKGRHRPIMAPRRYTELFFLDEAVALAAGHRPCAECQRERFVHFRTAWAQANAGLIGETRPPATTIDRLLHGQRIDAAGRKITYQAQLAELPDGTFIAGEPGDTASLVLGNLLFPWAPEGYRQPQLRPRDIQVQVLTPHSVVRALAQGYRPLLHPSAESGASQALRT